MIRSGRISQAVLIFRTALYRPGMLANISELLGETNGRKEFEVCLRLPTFNLFAPLPPPSPGNATPSAASRRMSIEDITTEIRWGKNDGRDFVVNAEVVTTEKMDQEHL